MPQDPESPANKVASPCCVWLQQRRRLLSDQSRHNSWTKMDKKDKVIRAHRCEIGLAILHPLTRHVAAHFFSRWTPISFFSFIKQLSLLQIPMSHGGEDLYKRGQGGQDVRRRGQGHVSLLPTFFCSPLCSTQQHVSENIEQKSFGLSPLIITDNLTANRICRILESFYFNAKKCFEQYQAFFVAN